jgi:putative tryptophan/tyrosine transport system substrate-binding protein
LKTIIGKILVLLLTIFLLTIVSPTAAQQKKAARILLLSSYVKSADQERIEAFRQGLRDLGYTEEANAVIEYHWYGALNSQDRQSKIAADLRGFDADVILVSGGSVFTGQIKKMITTIPIVMTAGSDPVETGLISSLARPGGNVTGLTSFTLDLAGKRLELLKESVRDLSRAAIVYDGGNPSKVLELKETETAARGLRIGIQPLDVRSPVDFESAFKTAAKARSQALITLQNPLTVIHLKKIADLATKRRLPMMVAEKGLLEAGGVMSYGPDYIDLYRRAATYVDKILKGTKPADLPVEQPMKFEFIINLKAAKQIGLMIPPNVLARADKVIK